MPRLRKRRSRTAVAADRATSDRLRRENHGLRCGFALALLLVCRGVANADDHSPLFSYATPVNAQGEISYDSGSQFSTGSAFHYGLRPHVTLSALLPAVFGNGRLPESRILSGSEWSAGASWRFVDSAKSLGRRVESTASLSAVVPGSQLAPGVIGQLHRAPGVAGTLTVGVASRSQYLWVGGGYTRFAEADHDRRPDTISWSGTYGYRPPRLRRGLNQWDYRGFAELTGEHTGGVHEGGLILPSSSSTTLWLGPSVLAIFKEFTIEAGVQGPLYRNISERVYGREGLRFAINLSFLHFASRISAH